MSNEGKEYDHYMKMQYLMMGDFLAAILRAKKSGVGEEWLYSFFNDYGKITDKGFKEAIAFANKEWDL